MGFTEFCQHGSGGGSTSSSTTTTTTSTTTTSSVPAPVETGVRNSSPGSLQGFVQRGTGIQQLYTNDGRHILDIPVDLVRLYANYPPGATIPLQTTDGQNLTLTNQGNGSFTGQYNGGDFNFNRSDDLTVRPPDPETGYSHDYISDDPDAPIPSYFIDGHEKRILNANGEPIYLPRDIAYGSGPGQRSDLSEAIAQAILGPSATEREIQDLANHDILVVDMEAARQLQAVNQIRNNPDREEAARLLEQHQAAVAQLQQQQQFQQAVEQWLGPVNDRFRGLDDTSRPHTAQDWAERNRLNEQRNIGRNLLRAAEENVLLFENWGRSQGKASQFLEGLYSQLRQLRCGPVTIAALATAIASAEERVATLQQQRDVLTFLFFAIQDDLTQARERLGLALAPNSPTRGEAIAASAEVARLERQLEENRARVNALVTEQVDAETVLLRLRMQLWDCP